jgi:hypothetical protein
VCWKPRSSCWSFNLLREEFLSAPIHSPPSLVRRIGPSVSRGIGRVICWGSSHRVGWSVGCSIGSGVDWLCYFVFALSFFSHRVEGTLATTSLARMLRPSSGVGTCYRPAVSRTSFFNLSSYYANVGLEASDHWGIFEVIQSGKSGSQVGLR